jgi:hypothetical protein
MASNNITSQQLFNSGVPPLMLFKSDLRGLDELITSSDRFSNKQRGFTNKTAGLCVIGLVSYFEAFCKNQFAAVVNICPKVLSNFVAKRDTVTIELKNLLDISGEMDHRLGSLLSEKFDFGSAKVINGLFSDLFQVSPFSKKDAEEYRELLNDRNLLVHHGGIYTSKYSGQRRTKQLGEAQPYWFELVVKGDAFIQWSEFLDAIATRTALACYKSLRAFVDESSIELGNERKEAIEYLLKETL